MTRNAPNARSPRLHIIASCTDRKAVAISPALRLRSVPRGPITERAKRWWKRLKAPSGEPSRAIDVYSGNHWAVVRSLPRLAIDQGFDAKLWVLSAGYGLIGASTPIRGYSATFAKGHKDSVGESPAELLEWWTALAALPIPGWKGPRSLAELIKRDVEATYLIVGSPRYVAAIEGDVSRALGAHRKTPLVLVSSSRGLKGSALERYCVPCEARFRHLVGGPLASLHACVARHIIQGVGDHHFKVRLLRTRYDELMRRLKRRPSGHEGIRQGDEDVRHYIRSALGSPKRASYTSLLRRMRSRGLACEAHRFKRLYLKEARRRGGNRVA